MTSGGQLVVTDGRTFFQPNRFDSAIGRKIWECPLEAVSEVVVLDRQPKLWFSGGMRRRLAIRTNEGVETFVVNHVDAKVAELRRLFGLA